MDMLNRVKVKYDNVPDRKVKSDARETGHDNEYEYTLKTVDISCFAGSSKYSLRPVLPMDRSKWRDVLRRNTAIRPDTATSRNLSRAFTRRGAPLPASDGADHAVGEAAMGRTTAIEGSERNYPAPTSRENDPIEQAMQQFTQLAAGTEQIRRQGLVVCR